MCVWYPYSQVDIVGGCNKTHGDPCKRQYRCTMEMKSKYKFYLSFENSQCQEYITEKFWKALNEGMVSSHQHLLNHIFFCQKHGHNFTLILIIRCESTILT